MYNNYKKDLQYGQMKELVTLNVLKKVYGLDGIIDNEGNKHDIILNNTCVIENKADSFIITSRKLWLEICGNIRLSKDGWLLYSDAHILAYHVVEPNKDRTIKIIFIDFISLQNYVKNEYFDGDFSNPVSDFSEIKYKLNEKAILIPINEFQQFVICVYSTVEKREIYKNPKYSSLKDFTEFIVDLCPVSA